jgi:hypothetical protein
MADVAAARWRTSRLWYGLLCQALYFKRHPCDFLAYFSKPLILADIAKSHKGAFFNGGADVQRHAARVADPPAC